MTLAGSRISKQVYALLAQLVFDYTDVACGVKYSKDFAKISCTSKTVQFEFSYIFEGEL